MNKVILKNKFNQISKKTIQFLPWILIGLCLLLVLFLVWPNFNKVMALKNKIQDQQALLVAKKIGLKDFEEIQKRYQDKEVLDKIDQALPAEQDLPNLLVQIEALALENNMLSNSVGFESQKEKAQDSFSELETEPVPQDSSYNLSEEKISSLAYNLSEAKIASLAYKTTAIHLELVGTYQNFKKYLDSIASNLRLMDVMEIELSSSQKSSDNSSDNSYNMQNATSSQEQEEYGFSLKINVYYKGLLNSSR